MDQKIDIGKALKGTFEGYKYVLWLDDLSVEKAERSMADSVTASAGYLGEIEFKAKRGWKSQTWQPITFSDSIKDLKNRAKEILKSRLEKKLDGSFFNEAFEILEKTKCPLDDDIRDFIYEYLIKIESWYMNNEKRNSDTRLEKRKNQVSELFKKSKNQEETI